MSSACPTHDDLAAYCLGKLPHDRCEEIDMHLEQCTECQAELETCGNADDTFLSRLREPDSSADFFEEAECAEVMARVAAIGREPSFTTQQQLDERSQAAPDLGDVGPYRLLSKLGAGGMGTVYKAFHTKLKRVVALKMLPTDRIQDKQAVARFEREMEAVGKLVHPNIVLAHDAGEHDGKYFLVMEYVAGIDLSDLVRQRGPLPISAACELIRQAALGLQHAHEHGLVHRDIKPSNLMLTDDGTTKILDLGLALLPETGEAGRDLTSTGQTMGTLDYMAPEQCGDSHDVDIRADIYSLGATLFKLLTGDAMYSGPKYRTPVQKLRAITLEPALPIRESRSDVCAELADVIEKMLAKNPDKRYATPAAVAGALAPFAETVDLSALQSAETAEGDSASQAKTGTTTSLLREAAEYDTSTQAPKQPLADAESAPTQTMTPSVQSAGPPARRGWQYVALAAGLIGILALAAVLVFRTPKGTVTVEVDDRFQDEITIIAKRSGKEIEINSETGWQIKLEEGTYQLDLKDSGDRFRLSKNTLNITRGKDEVLRVTYEPVVAQVPPTESGSPTTPLNGLSVKLRHDFGKILGPVEGSGIDFSPDSKLLAVSGHGGVRLFDTTTGELQRFVNCHDEHDDSVGVAFSPDGLLLASLGHGTQIDPPETVVCTTKDWNVSYRSPCYGTRLVFSPDGKQLACHSGTPGTDLQIFDAATGELVHRCSPDDKHYWGRDVAYSPDGKHILTTYHKADPHIWNAETGELVQVVDIDTARTYSRGDFLSDRTIMVEASDKSYVVNLQTNARKTRDDEFWTLSPDRELAASRGQGLEGNDNVILWSTASGKVLAEITDHTADIREVAFSPDGNALATTSDDETLKIWDLRPVQSLDHVIAKEVFALGGKVMRNGQVHVSKIEDLPAEEKIWAIFLENVTIPKGLLARLKSLDHPISLAIGGPALKDELLSELAGLNIPSLALNGSTKMTGRGLEHLSHTASIRELALVGTGIRPDDYGLIDSIPGISHLTIGSWMAPSAQAWKRIAEIETLRTFILWGDTSVVYADLTYLAEMEQLTSIVIHDSEISDADLKHLEGSKNLKHLDLTEINVTAEAVAALREALPKCEVKWDGITRDHRAAKWVLSVGGRVEISIDGGSPLIFPRPGQKLPFTRFDVTHVALNTDRGRELSQWDFDAQLHRLRSLPKLEHISLQGTEITDEGIAHLANLSSLRYLNCSTTKITDQGLQHLKNLSGLEELYVSSNRKITDAGVAHLSGLRNLTHLDIAETSITNRSMQLVGQMQKLRQLQIHGTYVTDEGLEHLGTLKDLEELQLQNCQVTDKGMAHITGLTKLRSLGLGPEQFTEEGIESVHQLPNLERLFLGTRVSDAELERVASFTKLKELQLMYGGGRNLVTDKGLESVAKLSQLKTLDLGGTQMTDAGVEHLAKLSKLQFLNVSDTNLTVDAVAKLKLAHPKCAIKSDFTDDEIASAMEKLKVKE